MPLCTHCNGSSGAVGGPGAAYQLVTVRALRRSRAGRLGAQLHATHNASRWSNRSPGTCCSGLSKAGPMCFPAIRLSPRDVVHAHGTWQSRDRSRNPGWEQNTKNVETQNRAKTPSSREHSNPPLAQCFMECWEVEPPFLPGQKCPDKNAAKAAQCIESKPSPEQHDMILAA